MLTDTQRGDLKSAAMYIEHLLHCPKLGQELHAITDLDSAALKTIVRAADLLSGQGEHALAAALGEIRPMIKPLEWNDYETSIICSHTATTFCLAYAVTRYKMANGEWASYAVTVGEEMIGRCPDLDGAKGMAEQHWKNLLSPYVCTPTETTGISAESVAHLRFAARSQGIQSSPGMFVMP